jgi:hypothetical protein
MIAVLIYTGTRPSVGAHVGAAARSVLPWLAAALGVLAVVGFALRAAERRGWVGRNDADYHPELHDVVTARWLQPRHARDLAAGRLAVPPRVQFAHRAVMVSTGPGRRDVAWVDQRVAELVYQLVLHGWSPVESCQGGPERAFEDLGETRASVWFSGRREATAFAAVAGEVGEVTREGVGVHFAPELADALAWHVAARRAERAGGAL